MSDYNFLSISSHYDSWGEDSSGEDEPYYQRGYMPRFYTYPTPHYPGTAEFAQSKGKHRGKQEKLFITCISMLVTREFRL